jgi:hypothetical protein
MTTEKLLQSNLRWMNEHPGRKVTCGNDLLSEEENNRETEAGSKPCQASGVPVLPEHSNLFGFTID